MTCRKNYIIYAPSFDETSGGNILLHLLAHTLNEIGESAVIWPWGIPPKLKVGALMRRFWHKPRSLLNINLAGHKMKTNPDFTTPQANYSDLRLDSIVIYPEVTLGNPLGAQNVARWLLYTPGLNHPFEFTKGEMYFRAAEMFDIPSLTGGAPDLYLWHIHPAYKNENRHDRSGACYTLRKGRDKPRIRETENAICIDGLSHSDTADIFNKCAVFYSYDEATFYSQYAALCGCLSIVVPGQFKSRQEWVSAIPLGRYGIAYGLDDTAHALETKDHVRTMLEKKAKEGISTVSAFVEATQKAFEGSGASRT